MATLIATGIIGRGAYMSRGIASPGSPVVVALVDATPTTSVPLAERPAAVVLEPVRSAPGPRHIAGAPSTVRQTVVIPVHAGPLTVGPNRTTVWLTRVGSSRTYRVKLERVAVVDARGSLAGWTLTMAVGGIVGGAVHVRPGHVDSTIQHDAVCTPITLRDDVPRPVCHADAGGGGGTTTLDIEFTASLSDDVGSTSVAGWVVLDVS